MRFQHACIRVAEHLAGQNLVDGDAVLDEARKVVFGMHFENCPVAEIADAMAASDLARAICVEIQHLSFDDAARVLVD